MKTPVGPTGLREARAMDKGTAEPMSLSSQNASAHGTSGFEQTGQSKPHELKVRNRRMRWEKTNASVEIPKWTFSGAATGVDGEAAIRGAADAPKARGGRRHCGFDSRQSRVMTGGKR